MEDSMHFHQTSMDSVLITTLQNRLRRESSERGIKFHGNGTESAELSDSKDKHPLDGLFLITKEIVGTGGGKWSQKKQNKGHQKKK